MKLPQPTYHKILKMISGLLAAKAPLGLASVMGHMEMLTTKSFKL